MFPPDKFAAAASQYNLNGIFGQFLSGSIGVALGASLVGTGYTAYTALPSAVRGPLPWTG